MGAVQGSHGQSRGRGEGRRRTYDDEIQTIDRPSDGVPVGAAPPDNERVALYDTMSAYAGTYSVEAGEVIHHVDISWNETWTGTDQNRLFEVSGNTLTLTTRITDPASGTEAP